MRTLSSLPTPGHNGGDQPAHARLLVVEPDALTRWALATYLASWFDVSVAPTTASAEEGLGTGPVAAILVSDSLPARDIDDLEGRARDGNPAVLILHLGTEPAITPAPPGVLFVEKPFHLHELARLLGVTQVDAHHN